MALAFSVKLKGALPLKAKGSPALQGGELHYGCLLKKESKKEHVSIHGFRERRHRG